MNIVYSVYTRGGGRSNEKLWTKTLNRRLPCSFAAVNVDWVVTECTATLTGYIRHGPTYTS